MLPYKIVVQEKEECVIVYLDTSIFLFFLFIFLIFFDNEEAHDYKSYDIWHMI